MPTLTLLKKLRTFNRPSHCTSVGHRASSLTPPTEDGVLLHISSCSGDGGAPSCSENVSSGEELDGTVNIRVSSCPARLDVIDISLELCSQEGTVVVLPQSILNGYTQAGRGIPLSRPLRKGTFWGQPLLAIHRDCTVS